MKKLVIMILCLTLLMGCSFLYHDFEDNNLRIGVERVMRQKGLTRKDYDLITHIDLSYFNIENLEGIEHLSNLESIKLSDNMINDISPLASLENLRIVDIQNNQVTDLTPLKSLEGLEILLIRNNPIEDVNVLENLFMNLKTTDFLVHVEFEDDQFETYLRDLLDKQDGFLTYNDLEKLRSIDLTGLDVTDITGIQHARYLEKLIISKPVLGLQQISALEKLKQLEISNSTLKDLNILKLMTELKVLDLHNNEIDSINILKKMTKLTTLHLEDNHIKDLSPLNNLMNLNRLYIANNYILDYDAIQSLLTRLEDTDIFIVYFSDIQLDQAVRIQLKKESGVITKADLSKMKSLDASGFAIESLGGIESMSNLLELNLSNNVIRDITPLKDLDQLIVLKLSNNMISDLQPMVYHNVLQILDLSNNEITSIDPLLFIEDLDYLYLSGNIIEESSVKESLKDKVKVTDEW